MESHTYANLPETHYAELVFDQDDSGTIYESISDAETIYEEIDCRATYALKKAFSIYDHEYETFPKLTLWQRIKRFFHLHFKLRRL